MNRIASLLPLLMLVGQPARAQSANQMSNPVVLIVVLGAISLAPFVVIMLTGEKPNVVGMLDTAESRKVLEQAATAGQIVPGTALRSLFAQGLARVDSLCIGIDVGFDGALIDREGAPSRRLHAVGPLTRSAYWEIVAIPDIRNQCAELTSHLVEIHGETTAHILRTASSRAVARFMRLSAQ